MSILALGLNHKTAPVEIRERLSFAPEKIVNATWELTDLPEVKEAAIISTCNRTEIYANTDAPGSESVLSWLCQYHDLPEDSVKHHVYQYQQQAAIRHMLRVACGLDSLVLGEPQILGQIKAAYSEALKADSLGTDLNRLFQFAFSTAKQVRTDTEIGANPVSVAFAAVTLAKQIFDDFEHQTVLLIGAGETIELAARHLKSQGLNKIMIANRTIERAEKVAVQFDAKAILLEQLPGYLVEADIVISSTAAPLPILGKGTVESALKARKHKPMFMVDIAVPRDIESEVGELDDVYLYTVDDLESVIEVGRKSREEAAEQAEGIIEQQVRQYLAWLEGQKKATMIKHYREFSQDIRDEQIAKALKLLQSGQSPEEAINQLAHRLTNKLTHAPTQRMNQAAKEGDEALIKAAARLLGIEEQ